MPRVPDFHHDTGHQVPGLKVRVYNSAVTTPRPLQVYIDSALNRTTNIPFPGGRYLLPVNRNLVTLYCFGSEQNPI